MRTIARQAAKSEYDYVIDNSPIGRWAVFRFHEGTGTTITDALGTVGDASISGTNTGIWSSPINGIKGNTTAYVKISGDDDLKGIVDPSTASGYHILAGFTCTLGENVAGGNEWLFSIGTPISGPGGIGFRYATNAWAQMAWRAAGASAMETLQASSNHQDGSERHYLLDWDLTNPAAPVMTMYRNGAVNATDNSLDAGTGLPGIINASVGVFILCRHSDNSPYTTATEIAGSRTTSLTYLRDLAFGRVSQANASLIPELAAAWNNNRAGLPALLASL